MLLIIASGLIVRYQDCLFTEQTEGVLEKDLWSWRDFLEPTYVGFDSPVEEGELVSVETQRTCGFVEQWNLSEIYWLRLKPNFS